jgi:hypothetical protein
MVAITDNTLFYTLSTIAQATAAAFAFLGAFVLFRLQAADARLKDMSSELVDRTTVGKKTADLRQLVAAQKYREIHELLSVSANANESINTNYTAFGAELDQVIQLRVLFRRSVIPSLALMAASVVGLMLVDQYVKTVMASCILIAFVTWFIAVLYLMSGVIRACLPK